MKESLSHHNGNGKIHSIDQALDLLSHVVDERAEEIRNLISNDYKNLKQILSDAKPEVKSIAYEAANSIKEKTAAVTKDLALKVDESAHTHTWKYVGGSALFGLIIGMFLRNKTR